MGSPLVISLLLLVCFLSLLLFAHPSPIPDSPSFKGINLGQPSIDITPSTLSSFLPGHGAKEIIRCERVEVIGLSRLRLGSYSSALRVKVLPSSIPKRLPSKIQVCLHRNSSRTLCECEKDEWKSIQKGVWSSVISPYVRRYVDVKIIDEVPSPITVSISEEPQQWRLLCLALGFILLLLAPVISGWVPFYYSSSMAIGILLVVIVLLFQGMKLLPTGRKNAFYLTLYGSMLGAGSFLLHQFSMMVNAILVNFGFSEEMHNPVSVFLLVGIVLAGAALGYWIVRKFVISEDGSVDDSVAQFVKWAMRVVAAILIFQSTFDTLLAVGALASCVAVCLLVTSSIWSEAEYEPYSLNWSPTPCWSRQPSAQFSRAEFLARSPEKCHQRKIWNRPNKSAAWLDSPLKSSVTPPASQRRRNPVDYYSTLHKTPNRKRYTEQEWEDSKAHWTRQAMSELASSPEFTDWIIEHADRIRITSGNSSHEAVGSDSDSTSEATLNSSNGFKLFNFC
ncbi:uncharacterized protein LOC115731119 [Rhodamnia argentea]|uniref:Uncharacterized protein LOC115731119 n=1 Tax=Rhodamnia argentea TaxID=178133 RepID=A0A8B8N6L5_9MYRT|nr:uncharacterized protein LOC115731119 [Rhodamnia argentea]